MSKQVSDFIPILRAAIAEAREAGLQSQCDELESRVFACYTTSSEWLGECGLAITAFKSANRKTLARSTKRQLNTCLKEIGKVWPRFRPWLPWV